MLSKQGDSTISPEAPSLSPATSLASAPWPYFAIDEVEAAVRVMRSGEVNYWTGEEGKLFEKEFARFAGCRYAIALANGTVALELALRGLGIGPGDEVVTPARTYFASASCIVAVGAKPVFADIDRDSQNVTAATIRAALTPRTRAVVVVHLAGWPCEMEDILALAREHNLKVIEDCAQAHGALYQGRPVGSFGDVAAFSFCQDKIMTTAGEGGMVTTSSESLWETMWSYKDHGKDFHAVHRQDHPPGFRWLHSSFGTNWRLSEVQSAVGRVQLKKLPGWIEARRGNAATLAACIARHPVLRVPAVPPHSKHAFYKFYAFVDRRRLAPGWDRNRMMKALNDEGVFCSTGSCSEVYLEAAFPQQWRPAARLSNAQELGETSLMFLVHPTLTQEHMLHACERMDSVLLQASA
jgi:dTDP-4-amino-4,6-dideoxygalactose transaminase